MPGKAEGVMSDAKVAGTFLRVAGPVIFLSFCVVVLTISLVVSMVSAKVGTDRYTGNDHKAYVKEVREETNVRWEEQHQVNQEVNHRFETLGATSQQVSEDVAVTKSKVMGIEKDLAEIMTLLLRDR